MNTDAVILFPVTHEQTLPTLHVHEELRDRFLKFLEKKGLKIAEPPEHLDGTALVEILLEAGTSQDDLKSAKDEFLASL